MPSANHLQYLLKFTISHNAKHIQTPRFCQLCLRIVYMVGKQSGAGLWTHGIQEPVVINTELGSVSTESYVRKNFSISSSDSYCIGWSLSTSPGMSQITFHTPFLRRGRVERQARSALPKIMLMAGTLAGRFPASSFLAQRALPRTLNQGPAQWSGWGRCRCPGRWAAGLWRSGR